MMCTWSEVQMNWLRPPGTGQWESNQPKEKGTVNSTMVVQVKTDQNLSRGSLSGHAAHAPSSVQTEVDVETVME